MATYLVAFAILPEDYSKLETRTQNNKPLRVFARKNAVDSGFLDYALNVSKKLIDYFENVYFDSSLRAVPPKIDHIAFPDFQAGAMENWGLVGYKESNLFFSESRNTEAGKQGVAAIIAHETSHFWFGNLGKRDGCCAIFSCPNPIIVGSFLLLI